MIIVEFGTIVDRLVKEKPELNSRDAGDRYAFNRAKINKSHIQNEIQNRIIERLGDDERVGRLKEIQKLCFKKRKCTYFERGRKKQKRT